MEIRDGKVVFGEREALKALINGESWNGGTHRYSLPTQAADGSWAPGEWTPRRPVSMLASGHRDGVPITGWYLTRDLVEWWQRGPRHATDAYLVEWRGVSVQSADKICVAECRLLRPLSDEELATLGVYRSGRHEEIASGVAWVGGSAVVERVSGSGSVGIVSGSGRVEHVSGSGRVEHVSGSGRVEHVSGSGSVEHVSDSGSVEHVYGSGRVGSVSDSGSVGSVSGSGRVGSVYGSGRVGHVYGSGRVGSVYGSGSVEHVYGSGSVEHVYGSGSVEHVYGSGRVGSVSGSGSVGSVSGSGSVHSAGRSAVTVTSGSPAVTREEDAVIIDRRGPAPEVYVKRGGIDGWRYRDGKQVKVKIRAKGGTR